MRYLAVALFLVASFGFAKEGELAKPPHGQYQGFYQKGERLAVDFLYGRRMMLRKRAKDTPDAGVDGYYKITSRTSSEFRIEFTPHVVSSSGWPTEATKLMGIFFKANTMHKAKMAISNNGSVVKLCIEDYLIQGTITEQCTTFTKVVKRENYLYSFETDTKESIINRIIPNKKSGIIDSEKTKDNSK